MSFLWFYISLRSLMYTGRMWHVNEFLNYTQYIFFLSLQSWIQKVRSFIFLRLTHLFLAIGHIKKRLRSTERVPAALPFYVLLPPVLQSDWFHLAAVDNLLLGELKLGPIQWRKLTMHPECSGASAWGQLEDGEGRVCAGVEAESYYTILER